ncbi:MAG: hypothetical protein ABIG42_04590 [bacterium]
MQIKIDRSLHMLGLILVITFIGIIATVIINSCQLNQTKQNRAKMEITPVISDLDDVEEAPFIPVEKASTVVVSPGTLKGFSAPVLTDAPAPVNSIKANTIIDNLLFAMKYFARVPESDEMTSSVFVWDAETGYYIADSGAIASQIMALSRNARYLLILKLYQTYFPSTHYFDDDSQRVKRILDKFVDPETLNSIISSESFYSVYIPDQIYYDLFWLYEITGEGKYRDAALTIADKHSDIIFRQAVVIKNNRDRSDKVRMFNDAALGYIYGKEIGKLDLQEDARLVMDELIEELWADKYSLLYTDVTIGSLGNITTTFITNDQMHALAGMIRYAEASGDKRVEDLARKILESLANGSNPVCDTVNQGFYRRYNGDSRSPHKDYKLAEDHLVFLEALIKLNILNDGKFDDMLNYHYEWLENYLYDTTNNAIYFSYDETWKPYKYANNRPVVSVDAILDFILLTLEDRIFRTEKKLGIS